MADPNNPYVHKATPYPHQPSNSHPDNQRRDAWPSYYIEEKSLGSGAYGAVVEALDARTGRKVAIKKQFTNFSVVDKKDKPVLALRAYRELLLLWTFRGHPNILHLLDAFPLQTDATMGTLCTVTNKMDMDLATALQENRITPEMRPFIMYSVLCGMKDLKPSNIGISFHANGSVRDVRLLDFGLARKLKVEMSYVVQTMWYRAPEVWLQPGRYTKAIDLWSVGCILAELITGQPLMRGGTAFGAQLQTIYGYLGEVGKDFLRTVDASYISMLSDFEKLNAKRKPLSEVLPGSTEQETDILDNLFRWNPDDRFTAARCLEHPYFATLVEKKGNGGRYTGTHPEHLQDFENWDNRTLEFWSGWVDQQIRSIMHNLASNHESPAVT